MLLRRGETAWYQTPREKQLVIRVLHDSIDTTIVTAVPLAPNHPEADWPMAVQIDLNQTELTAGRPAWALPLRLANYPTEALRPAGLAVSAEDLASLDKALAIVLGLTLSD